MAAASSSAATPSATPSATSANFRNPYTLFPLLMNPDSFNLFLFACHGTIVGKFPVPENTILIQTGDEATGCLALTSGVNPLKAMFEEGEYMRSFTYFLGEGMNTRSGHELISYLAFNVFKENALEKTLTLNQSDLNSKLSELFGIFKLEGKKFRRETELQRFLINNPFILTSNMIKHVNHLHPDKVNIFVFFTCADVQTGTATGILESRTHFASPVRVAPAEGGGLSSSAVAATAALSGGGFAGNGSASSFSAESVRPAGASAASSGRPAALTPASSFFQNTTSVSTDVDPLLVFEESYSEFLENQAKIEANTQAIREATAFLTANLTRLKRGYNKALGFKPEKHTLERLNKVMKDTSTAIQENQKLISEIVAKFGYFNYVLAKSEAETAPESMNPYVESQIPSKLNVSPTKRFSLDQIRKSIVELYGSLPEPLNIMGRLPEDLAGNLVSNLQVAQTAVKTNPKEIDMFREIVRYIQYIRNRAVHWYYNKIGMSFQEIHRKFDEAKALYDAALAEYQTFKSTKRFGRRLTRRQRKQRRSSRHR